MHGKPSLSIRLTEPVVVLQTTSRSAGHQHGDPVDCPPALVRGLLTLDLAKPMRISSIEAMLEGRITNAWTQDLAGGEEFYSASTVFFKASASESIRRTVSVGPSIPRRSDESGSGRHSLNPSERPLTPSSRASRPHPRVRRASVDGSTFQRDSHSQDTFAVPSQGTYNSAGSPTVNSRTSIDVEHDMVQAPAAFQNALRSDAEETPAQSTPTVSGPSTSPPYSPSSVVLSPINTIDDTSQREADIYGPTGPSPPSPGQSSRSGGDPDRASSTGSPSPGLNEWQTSHFSLSGLSNMVLGAVKGDGKRPSSPTTNATARGRSQKKAKDSIQHPHHSMFKELLGLDGDEVEKSGRGWKEFKKGTHTYPISFTIPTNSLPTLQCDYGSVEWRLEAVVHRPGAFVSKLTAVQDVLVVSCPREDDIDEDDSRVVERQWEQQLRYLISIPRRMFYVGCAIPVQFTFLPLEKVNIHRLAVILEEWIDYGTADARISHAPVCRTSLLFLRHTKAHGTPILPLESDDVDAFKKSPLYAICTPADDPSEMAASFMGPGPWVVRANLKLPTCKLMHFTYRHKKCNILISHALKFIVRVEKSGSGLEGRRRLFDIVVQFPVHIFSCRCNPELTSLPGYSARFKDPSMALESCPCQDEQMHTERYHPLSPVTSTEEASRSPPWQSIHLGHLSQARPTVYESAVLDPNTISTGHPSEIDTLLHRNEQFERLISGQESETGEAPPAYTSFAASVGDMDVPT